jgi:RNA polymerase sigma-70 factor (ECF subfamily)
LLQKAAGGDRKAFSVLYGYYSPLLIRFLYPLAGGSPADAEEVAQEVFLKIWEKREVMMTILSFEAYIFRMARNIMVSRWRRKMAARRAEEQMSRWGEALSSQTEDDILLVEYHDIARKALATLPPRQRQIFELRTQQDLKLEEIAVHLGISLAAVKKQLYAAIDKVRAYLRRHAGLVLGLIISLVRGL